MESMIKTHNESSDTQFETLLLNESSDVEARHEVDYSEWRLPVIQKEEDRIDSPNASRGEDYLMQWNVVSFNDSEHRLSDSSCDERVVSYVCCSVCKGRL